MGTPAHASERFERIMDYLEAHGGEIQMKLIDFAGDVGMPHRAFSRHMERMEELGVVEVTRTSADFGVGRSPNSYRLVIGTEQWESEGPAIVKEWRKRRRVERAEQRRRAEAEWAYQEKTKNLNQPAPVEPEVIEAASTEELELAAATAQVVAEVEASLEAGDPDALEDAWAHGG